MKTPITMFPLVLSLALTLAAPLLPAAENTAPAQATTPAAEMQRLVRKLGKPGLTAALVEHKQAIADWQTRIDKKKAVEPLVLQLGPSPVGMPIKTSTVQGALGKPTRKTTDSMPGLVDRSGKLHQIPVYWYGNVGFGFAQGDGFDLGLCMIKLEQSK